MSSMHNLLTEHDERSRQCRIELYRRPIVGFIGYHWALYFRWEDGYDMHYEATDVDKRLIARCGRGKPENNSQTLIMYLGKKVLSPKKVNIAARENRHNGKLYVLTKMNCQVWAKELASDLKFTIPIPVNILKYIPGSELLDGVHFLAGIGSLNSSGSLKN